MPLSSQAVRNAAGALQRVSATSAGERSRRAEIVVLVLTTVEMILDGAPAGEFLLRRVDSELASLGSHAERAYLRRLLVRVVDGDLTNGASLLREYAADLEAARRIPEAVAVLDLARSLEPSRADLALSAGRLARISGDRVRALDLYAEARTLDDEEGSISRLAAVGEAVVGDQADRDLGRAVRLAIAARDQEAAAVGLEERGRLRRAAGNRSGAARDLALSMARFTDPVDRGRVGHLLADLFVAGQDLESAREVLLLTLALGDRSQKDHARVRLHTVSRDLGDTVGMRRWRSFERAKLVSLSTRPAESGVSLIGKVQRWCERFATDAAFANG